MPEQHPPNKKACVIIEKSEFSFTVQLLLLIRCLILIFQEVPSESGSVCI